MRKFPLHPSPICRICGRGAINNKFGKIVRVGVRHYAHTKCLEAKSGKRG